MQKDNDVILIDDVNVAECEYILSNLTCINKDIKLKKCIKLCANIPNCVIKENLRLKQVNETLKQELEIKEKQSEHFMIGTGKILDKLRQENKRLQMLSCVNCGEKYLSPDGSELYDKNVQLEKENKELKNRCEEWALETVKMQGAIDGKDFKIDKYKLTLKGIRKIIKTLITEMPEYYDCYFKDECGDNCTPKQQGKVTYCCFENVDKIENLINEALSNK